ncbi:hypothetical protein LIER_36808 [Lithospermum erythrorhizon]|uniref:Uncharacterized protein n=1 Tax=Lithospermum erythrorhizon TaxID=34254 RepID=A0AAV3PCZ0_LITER
MLLYAQRDASTSGCFTPNPTPNYVLLDPESRGVSFYFRNKASLFPTGGEPPAKGGGDQPSTLEILLGNSRYEKRGRDDIIYVRTAPRGVDPASNQVFDQGTGEFPLPLAGQPGRTRALYLLDRVLFYYRDFLEAMKIYLLDRVLFYYRDFLTAGVSPLPYPFRLFTRYKYGASSPAYHTKSTKKCPVAN